MEDVDHHVDLEHALGHLLHFIYTLNLLLIVILGTACCSSM